MKYSQFGGDAIDTSEQKVGESVLSPEYRMGGSLGAPDEDCCIGPRTGRRRIQSGVVGMKRRKQVQ